MVLPPISIGKLIIESKPTVGLTLDSKIEQIKAEADKDAVGALALSRLMTNIEDPTSTRQRLLMSAAHSILSTTWRYGLMLLARS